MSKDKERQVEKLGLVVIIMGLVGTIHPELYEDTIASVLMIVVFTMGLFMYVFPEWICKKRGEK